MAILLGAAANAAQPSREDLLRELLTSAPTRLSARFETLEPDKLDLLRSLPAYATERGLKLKALLMIGPNGPGRAHTVVVVLAQEESFRMSVVLTSGGRISRKGTTPIAADALARWVRGITASTLLIPAGSDISSLEAKLKDADFDLLLALFNPDELVLFVADLRTGDRSLAKQLIKVINGPMRAMRPTYPRE
ncbi:MAG: hypothetical protein O7F10_03370 [Deltaproteobacteria bacterium]|nr:hypothetical protein [Deltaproteobacteria bacterium]